MPVAIPTPAPRTLPSVRRPEATPPPEARASGASLAQLLCGGGLIVYGLLRGSWSGLTLAAVGGFLVYRGLTASPLAPAARRPFPPQDEVQPNAGRAPSPSVVLPPVESEVRLGQDHEGAADPASPPALGIDRAEELTPAEHAEAELAAYHHALHRGGGWLPPYEHAKAVEDFCLAAAIVFRRRVGG